MKYLALLTAISVLSVNALAEENRGEVRERIEPKGFIYGLGLGVNNEIYKGYDYRVIPLPIIGYRGDDLNVYGPFVSYDALQLSDIEITLQAAPRFQGFDESDSYIFENMQERKFSMDAGLGLSYERHDWKIGLSGMFDVLGRSKGYEAKANISRVFRKGPIFFEPSIAVSYLDSKHVDYYYGVKADEINQFTSQYQGESAINSTLSLSIATPIFLGGFTRFAIDYTFYGSAITDSPLVEDSGSLSARFLFSKFF
jgi:outer membrane protein